MPTRTLLLSALFASAIGAAATSVQAQSAGPVVTVTVTNIEQHRGTIFATLHTGNWNGRGIAMTSTAVDGASETLTLTAPGPGRYAVRLFQDLDGDDRLDFNLIGIPTEPTGTSNNAPPRMGPPRYSDAEFALSAAGAALAITLN
jgi:uncharacterized protein (DUF2141 family)